MSDLRIAGTVGESITDGPGFRFTIFTQGCPHHCEGCHNPHTHDYNGGEMVDTDTLWEKIRANILLSGVTLSGGEPFEQAGALLDLAKKVKDAGLELAAYSGYTFEQLIAAGGDKLELLKLCDVLVDGRFVLAEKSLMLRFRGSKNQRLIDVQKSLEGGVVCEIHDGRWQD
ncbi:MAG: anaerobic ribonucleoside-triphosphate reductase activating protein [Clostridia bacterium]|nr:anaerobic ribonucleoside-triphosphate reductase activating protein [Clostridia bacterium]